MESSEHEPKWYERSNESGDNARFKYMGRCWLDDIIELTKRTTQKRTGFDKFITNAKVRAFQKAQAVPDQWLTKSMADYLYDYETRNFAMEEGIDMRSSPGDMKVFKLSKGKEPSMVEKVRDSDEIRIRTNLKDLTMYVYLTTHFKESLITQWYHMGHKSVPTDSEDKNNILYENRMLGSARLKMMRVTGDSCKVSKMFEKYQPYCFDYYTKFYQDDKMFQGKEKESWEHKLENGSSISGIFGDYNAQGFIEDVNADNIDRLDDLQSNHWIQRGTRALTTQFTVFNVNLKLFCNIILTLEIPPTGGIFPSYKFNTVKLISYYDPWDYFILGLEGGLGLYFIYFLIQTTREMALFGWIYFLFSWHYLDVLIIGGLLGIIILKSMLEIKMRQIFRETDLTIENPYRKAFTSFDTVSNLRIAHDHLFGTCASEMAYFIALVGFFFLAFAEMGTLMFGMGMPEYSTLGNAYLTLLRSIAGDTQFDELQQFDTILGPLYLITFLIFVINIVLNVSVSILNEAYLHMTRYGLRHKETNLNTIHYLKRARYNIFGSGKKSVLFRKPTATAKMYDSDIIELLLDHGFNPAEIHAFMAKYKLKQYKVAHHLSKRRQEKLVQDIKYMEMNSYVPIDFFLNSAKQLKLLVEKGEKEVVKKMQEQNTKPEDYARIARRLDSLDERYENVYTRMRRLHRLLKPKRGA
ncbi:polycystin-2-like [Chrysoperla carnea]|uniref:polycystin-2-like n=1 Tax=Chrysoperla carnea TaxID=189513 RepID=UPI001D0739C8|nr:polycystin-2-like [Chrysoperla carnea]